MIHWMTPRYNQLISGYPDWSRVAEQFSEWQTQKAIPYLIAAIDTDTNGRLAYSIGHSGLKGLTGVPYDSTHDGEWWKDWWQKNKTRYPEEIQKLDIEKIKESYLNPNYQ